MVWGEQRSSSGQIKASLMFLCLWALSFLSQPPLGGGSALTLGTELITMLPFAVCKATHLPAEIGSFPNGGSDRLAS